MRTRFEESSGSTTPVYAGFALLVVLLVAIFVFVSRQGQLYADFQQSIQERRLLSRVSVDLIDAETGQRGYLLTANKSYLEPYNAALSRIDADFKSLADIADGTSGDHSEIESVRGLADQKLTELRTTIDLHDANRSEQALALVNEGVGKAVMDQIRRRVDQLIALQQQRIDAHLNVARTEGNLLRLGSLVAILAALVVGATAIWRLRKQVAAISAARDDLRAANVALSAEAEQRAQLAAQLRQSQKMEAIGQLTGGLAHDFNNMLAVIVASIDLAKRHLAKKDGDPYRFLDAAQKGAERAAILTHRLLAFSRQQPLSPQPIDPNRMVAGMAELLHRTLGEVVQLETVLGAGLWTTEADPAQLENAILNLAVNARDAMPEGGKLTVETNNTYLDDDYAARHIGIPAGQYILIAVTDTGAGMTPETAERIFDPFFTTKPVGKGTGLGLSQVYGFVRQSGGHIKVYSEPGHGTTVKIYLPRHYGTASSDTTPRLEAPTPRGAIDETILIVEDDDNVRQLAVDSLVEMGYRVISSAGAADALRQLGSDAQIDVLFTDVVMPEMNGRKLADEALKQRPKLKVLFTTGYTQNAIVHGGVLDRGVDVIVKPYPIAKLARKIREMIDRPAAVESP